MEQFIRYLYRHSLPFVLLGLCTAIFGVTFWFYRLPLGAVWYPCLLCLVLLLVVAFVRVQREQNLHRKLKNLTAAMSDLPDLLPEAADQLDEDYQTIICNLVEARKAAETALEARYTDTVDYYTTWAHQIKTPIAAMRLTLQMEDSASSRKLMSELGRIEQYVEMAMAFLRLDTSYTDYVIRPYELDNMIRSSVRKFAGEFIQRKIRLDYVPIEKSVITDEKWFCFVLEQVLSNALKYTPSGSIRIYLDGEQLCIQDTGMGIAPEDLPRIFEKGYTGLQGRLDHKASGLGLYLCKQTCDRLHHRIFAVSAVDQGTTIRIDLGRYDLQAE